MTTESAPLASGSTGSGGPGLRRGFFPALAFANFAICAAFFTPIVLTVQQRVQQLAPADKAGVLSLVLLVSSILALITTPLTGRLSDRTTASWGMRRPWLVGGTVAGFGGLLVMGTTSTIPLLIVGSGLSQIGFAACQTILFSVLAEQIPPSSHGRMSALFGVGQAFGIIAGVAVSAAFGAVPFPSFVVPGIVGIAGIALICLLLRDRVLAPADRRPLSAAELLSSFWRNPVRFPDFGWAWISRFLLIMAFAGVNNYQVFYLTDQIGLPPEDVGRIVGVALGIQVVTIMLSNLVGGWISDRVGRRKPFVFGAAALGAVGLAVISLTTSLPLFLVGMAIGGMAQGTYTAVDLALIAEILPDKEHDNAKDFGVMALANQLPQTVSPAIAPLFLAIGSGGNYTAFFLGGAAFAVLSALTIVRVRGTR